MPLTVGCRGACTRTSSRNPSRSAAWGTRIRSERSPARPGSGRPPSTGCSTSGPASGPAPRRSVRQAIVDLDRQRSQLRLTGRTFLVDVVMHTPDRFSSAVKAALEHELPGCGRPPSDRDSTSGSARPTDIVKALRDIRHRGSRESSSRHPTSPRSRDAIGDSPTPAFPSSRWSPTSPSADASPTSASTIAPRARPPRTSSTDGSATEDGDVLIALSRSAFRGEEDREIGFRTAMRSRSHRRAR